MRHKFSLHDSYTIKMAKCDDSSNSCLYEARILETKCGQIVFVAEVNSQCRKLSVIDSVTAAINIANQWLHSISNNQALSFKF